MQQGGERFGQGEGQADPDTLGGFVEGGGVAMLEIHHAEHTAVFGAYRHGQLAAGAVAATGKVAVLQPLGNVVYLIQPAGLRAACGQVGGVRGFLVLLYGEQLFQRLALRH